MFLRKEERRVPIELTARLKVDLQVRDKGDDAPTCVCRRNKRKVAAEWLLDFKESTDSEFKYDQ